MHIAYFRVSTGDQSVESQRRGLVGPFDKEFIDDGVSGVIPASQRPAFANLLAHVRDGDTVHVYAIDRLGRDALDVQATVRRLMDAGVLINVYGLGLIGRGVGELIVAVLAQVADMERRRILQRTAAGRETAKQALALTGRTHHGKLSLGRPFAGDAERVSAWRQVNNATVSETMKKFGLSRATVFRYCSTSLAAS